MVKDSNALAPRYFQQFIDRAIIQKRSNRNGLVGIEAPEMQIVMVLPIARPTATPFPISRD
ncbi:MAG: hypothetical protein AAFV45_06115 [Pseudomonadota bacterium]